jgi:translocation and assembly module TamA
MARVAPVSGYRFWKLCANAIIFLITFGIPRLIWAKDKKPEPEQALCSRFTLKGKIEPGLTDTEKKLICGDKDKEGWRTIPFSQAQYDIKNFLQDRGYFHPVFVEDLKPSSAQLAEGQEAGHFTVEIGPPTRVTSLSADGDPESLRLYRKRKVVGQIMTPQLLGSVEQWINERLGAVGYPCPKVKAEANPETGAVVAHVETGPLQDLVSVFEEPLPGVEAGTLRRYDAFQLAKPYNGDLLTVTSNRITSLNIVQANYFTASCGPNGAVARQMITGGPPRFLAFGIGIDTEGLIQLRASWRNARMGLRASLAQASVQTSTKDQSINALFNWYHLPFPSRRYLQPYYQLQHLNQNAYEIIDSKAKFSFGTSYDNQLLGLQFLVGPALEFVHTVQGSGANNPNARFLELEASLGARSHDFEYWATDPRTGYNVLLVTDFATSELVSTTSAQRFNLTGELLWNLRDYDPPFLIFGLRGGIRTTLSPQRPGADSLLPANFFWYLGGSVDLRGFSLQSVPSFGAMTAFYLDPEIRLYQLLPLGIEPFFFWDIGAVGRAPVTFDSPLLYSPGIGLRYKSPFGVFRTTLARGYPIAVPGISGGWNFYFSFGEEF